jgi:hypothetical protein
MVYTSLTQVSSPNLHHTSFTCQSGYTRSALGELCDDDIMAVAQRPLHDEITVEGASMKTGLAGKGADYRRYVESWPRQCAGLCRRRSAPVALYEETAHLATLLLSVCCSPCLGSVLHARRRLPRLSRACLQPQGHAAAVRQPMGGRYGGRALSTGASWGGTR